MNRKREAAAAARQQHQTPVDEDDMTPSLGTETPETDAIRDDGEPIGDNFA